MVLLLIWLLLSWSINQLNVTKIKWKVGTIWPSKFNLVPPRWWGLGNELTQVSHHIALLPTNGNIDGNVNLAKVGGCALLPHLEFAVWGWHVLWVGGPTLGVGLLDRGRYGLVRALEPGGTNISGDCPHGLAA